MLLKDKFYHLISFLFLFAASCTTVSDIRNIPIDRGPAQYYSNSPADLFSAMQMTLSNYKNIKVHETIQIKPSAWLIIAEIPWTFYRGGPEYLRVTIEPHGTGTIVRVLSKWKPFTFAGELDHSGDIFNATHYFLSRVKETQPPLSKKENAEKAMDYSAAVSHDTKLRKKELIENSDHEDFIQKLIKDNPQSFVKKPYVGVYVIINNKGEFEVASVGENSPAGRAGVQIGDIIESVDNLRFKDRISLFEYVYEKKKPGESVNAMLRRGGETKNIIVKLESTHFSYDQYALYKEITNEKPLNLAIIIGDITNIYLQDKSQLEQWKAGMKSVLISDIGNLFLQMFKHEKNFSILDREKIESILNELTLQQTGLISEASRVKIGEIYGATHLLIVDYSRFTLSSTMATDVQNNRLIEIKSGRTLASIHIKKLVKLETAINPLQEELSIYKNNLSKIWPMEDEAVEAFSRVTGKNYIGDTYLLEALKEKVIPKYEIFVSKLTDIHPVLEEIKHIHKIYVAGAMLQLESFKIAKEGLEKQDATIINKASIILNQGREKIQEWHKRIDSLK